MEFTVSDTGRGIPKEYLERVFMPYEPGKQDNGTTGSGLGLAITYNLVHMMGGVISVTSEEGKGTQFVLEIPFGYTEEKNRNMEEIQVFPFVKALVVDDQENSCKYLEALLKRFNVETAIATSGSAALSTLNEANLNGKPFNLCLLDWKMPGMDGLELAKKIQEMKFKNLKVAMVSGHDLSVIRNEGAALGLCAMLGKPLFAANIFSLLMENFEDEANDLKKQAHHYDFKGAQILVAEDNDINAELIVKLLEKVNCKVDRVTNGQEACEKFGTTKAGYYQAIFLDVDMPEIDGCETAKLIRMSDHPEGPTIPLIAMTDHALSEDVAKALGAGMNSFVEKPIVADKLYSALQNFME
jgi:two-component system sensor histidine kinase/response regulator